MPPALTLLKSCTICFAAIFPPRGGILRRDTWFMNICWCGRGSFVLGEHILSGRRLLRKPGFLHAADALTDWEQGKREGWSPWFIPPPMKPAWPVGKPKVTGLSQVQDSGTDF